MNIKIMKRTIIILLVLISFLNACYKNKSEQLINEINNLNLDYCNLTVYYLDLYSSLELILNEVIEKMNKRLKEEINTNINHELINISFGRDPDKIYYADSILKMLREQLPCDTFVYYPFGKDFEQLFDLRSLLDEGLIMPLNELLPKYAPNYYNKLLESEIKSVSVDGQICAVPRNYSPTNRIILLLRKDIVNKYNIIEINDYDELENVLRIIKTNEPELVPLNIAFCSAIAFFIGAKEYNVFDRSLGLVYKSKDSGMELFPYEKIDEFMHLILQFNSWITKGYIDSKYSTSGSLNKKEKFASFLLSRSDYDNIWFGLNQIIFDNMIEVTPTFNYKVFVLNKEKLASRYPSDYYQFVIPAHSQNPERFIMFIEWLHLKQENYDMLRYGIEDKHYFLEGDRFRLLEYTPLYKSIVYWTGYQPIIDIDFERLHLFSPFSNQDQLKEIYLSSEAPQHIGFIPDYTSVSDIVDSRKAAITFLENTIQKGNLSEQKLNEIANESEKSGLNKLIITIQEQLDEWREKNL